jgi:hypothetical protein
LRRDPQVAPTTWDALQAYVGSRSGRLPVRSAGRLLEDLWIGPDDWVDDLLPEVAGRAGYAWQQPESSPLSGRLQTVGDLAKFITLQPKIGSGASRRMSNKAGAEPHLRPAIVNALSLC